MNIFTHVTLATKFKLILEERLDIKIKPVSFVYGNIKPDIKSRTTMKNHVNEHCPKHIDNLIKKIYADISEGISYSKFLVDLGCIFHFICDYFCLPHNSYYEGTRSEHHIYEHNQMVYVLRNINSLIEEIDFSIDEEYNLPKDLINAIEVIHQQYVKDEKEYDNYEKDVIYAFSTCIMVGTSIMKTYTKKYRKPNFALNNI